MLKFWRIAALLLALALFGGAAHATDATVTTTPANDCTVAPGATCSVTIAWNKNDASGVSFSLWIVTQNQDKGTINAPWPGVQIACNASGTGSYSVKLPANVSYTFTLMSGPTPCVTMDYTSKMRGNTWPLAPATAYLYVHN